MMSANFYWEPVNPNKREFESEYVTSDGDRIGAPRTFKQSDLEYLRGHADAGNVLAAEIRTLLSYHDAIIVTCEA